MSDARPPVVTDIDRQWALDQCPPWAARRAPDDPVHDDGLDADGYTKPRPRGLAYWDDFVSEQIDRFENVNAFDRRSPEAWSRLWRVAWWPKADASRRFPKSAPAVAYPFFRQGSQEFEHAMRLGSTIERKVWKLVGVAQFEPTDPRVSQIRDSISGATLTPQSRAMSGDAS